VFLEGAQGLGPGGRGVQLADPRVSFEEERELGKGRRLVVETAPGAGTKVTFRVPKYAPGVRAEP